MSDAALVVAFAGARSPRRPPGARHAVAHDALADAASANELLGSFLERPVGAGELAEIRALQEAVMGIVEALIDGAPAPLGPINALAARAPAVRLLERRADGELTASLRPAHASATAVLLLAVIGELGELSPSRLRRCARPECGLVFYDLTRSGTQRWHAERPCGLRERQRRHRDAHPDRRSPG